ncbi:hypothetical protein [Negadavirga shengliensis]|uniref:Uncharacterized protein n=1 Tax=Negadavirga shengliensis TaxID=1389218 RepID=A0ABV9T5B6_9BACT
MPQHITIPKDNSSFPSYLDWQQLRTAGIEHIENLGSDIWTDYNLHDPGITILEVLCYALTDLGYRTNFDIKDILSRSPEDKNLAPKTIFGKPLDDNFFTAADVLSCNPVTFTDFRKLLIDIPGIKNAWFERASDGEIPVAFHKDLKSLVFAGTDPANEKRIYLGGLYEICLELEPVLVRDACGSTFFTNEGILETVYKKLNAHRNLCEDIKRVTVFGEEQIRLCAEIELRSSASPENVLLEIHKKVEEHLSPSLTFYTLQEMLQKGKSMEEIFEGRPLSIDSNGFIDTEELKKLDPKKRLYASDLYRIIMDIEGVIAIRNLSLANAIDNVVMNSGEKWCLNLTPKYRPHFDLQHSQITFYKGVLPFTTDKAIVRQRYLEEKAAKAKAKLEGYHLDLPIPEGKYRDIEDYTSIMEDFPLTYGVGKEGLKGLIDVKRKGQAKQLKGYLLFYDQLLTNYLSQLANVRALFSMSPDEDRPGKTHTYFTRLLSEVPDIQELVENFHQCEGNQEDGLPPEDFPSYLQHIAESLENYHERRNRFLDHLLARFSESFSDYVLLMFEMNGKQHDGARIIRDKTDFLSNYPQTSRNRGKGFDYSKPVGCRGEGTCGESREETETDDIENISGLEKRVGKLIGIQKSGWQNLGNGVIKKLPGGWVLTIHRQNDLILKSKPVWETEEEACDALKSWQKYIGNEQYYRRLTYEVSGEKEYGLVLKNKDGEDIAAGVQRYPSIGRYCQARDKYFSLLQTVPEEKIKWESGENGNSFVIEDENGLEILRFYGEEENLETFREVIKEKKHYCRKAYDVDHNQEYGFTLVNENDECIAQGTKRYLDSEAREDDIYWLIGQINWSGLSGQAVREEECYTFQLFDYQGEKLLFESVKGFHSVAMAMDFFAPEEEDKEGFIDWAIRDDNYEFIEKDGKHSFQLLDGEEKTVSSHPHWYESEKEALNMKQAIIFYLDGKEPDKGFEGTPGSFGFEVTDTSGNILFESIHIYPTKTAARSASLLVKVLARHRRYYKPLEDNEKELPYGFELIDRNDKPIAAHPQWFATACERDLAMDMIIYYAENLEPQYRLTKKEEKYFIDLVSPDGKDLLVGSTAFADEASAKASWENFLTRASRTENYRFTDAADSKYPFGFELLDNEGKVMARSAISYATQAESNMALRAIIQLVRHTEWLVNISGETGSYLFWVGDSQESKLLQSVGDYPDETAVNAGLKQVLELGQHLHNYQKTENFGFELVDANGQVLANHPDQYESDAEVDAAIFMVINYIRNDAPSIEIPNIGGAFRAEIYDEKGKVAFTGIKIHSDKTSALSELEELFELASSAKNYRLTEAGQNRCQNGFQLVSKEGEILANHPFFYATPQERDEVMANIFGWLTYGEKITKDVIKAFPLFGFQLKDNEGNPVLSGVVDFESEDEAYEAFAEFITVATDLDNYKTDIGGEKPGFIIVNPKGEVLAKSEGESETEEARDEAMKSLWLTIKLRSTDHRIFQDEEQGKWHFVIGDDEGKDFLLGDLYLDSEPEAREALISTFEKASSKSHYKSVLTEEENTFSFHLVDDEENMLARSAGVGFGSEEDMDQAIEDYILFLTDQKIDPLIIETKKKYHIELEDFSEKVILQGNKKHYSLQSAKSEWAKITEAAASSSNFDIIYDNLNCLYKVVLHKDEVALAESTQKMTSRTQAEKWINLVALILKKQSPHGDANGTDCGYYFFLRPGDGTETIEEEIKDIEIRGTKLFPTSSEALRGSEKIAGLMRDDDHFVAEAVDTEWQLVLKDDHGSPIASVTPQFDDETAAVNTRDKLREFLESGGELGCEKEEIVGTVQQEEAYGCVVQKGDNVFLEAQGIKDKESARATCNLIHELGQIEERYNLITNEEECLYGFELTDKEGIPIATHPIYYFTARERDEALAMTMSIVNREGLHLVEHILLRPRKIALQQAYRFELIENEDHTVILQGSISYPNLEEAMQGYNGMWVALWKYAAGEAEWVEKIDDLEGPCPYAFKIFAPFEDDDKFIIAESVGGFGTGEKRDSQLDALVQIISELENEPEGSPDLPEHLDVKFSPLRSDDDLKGCQLMKPVLEHQKPGETVPPYYYDPYSFRATVVLPYWPVRFQQPEFRSFIEATLRQEAPAHVFLRICWVDTKHMKEFEDAYCHWVSTLQIGPDACDASEAKNKLIKTLCKLRSVYPVASLHDCKEPAEDRNRIVLNYSIIGSANSSSHGKPQ